MSAKRTTLRVSYDPLTELLTYYADKTAEKKEIRTRAAEVEDRLKARIVDGDKVGMQADLDEALRKYSALDIINTILLDGMKVVGDLFGSGQMQLPFVLQSAEVMKSAVAYLEDFMDKSKATSKGTLVIATVKGDVHDIGKNLVDIILTNNGYKVVNLGIKCSVETMLQSAREHHADAIGMSGLLVKSTLIMKENLEVMNERGVVVPVVLGGAALTRRYVEGDLRAIYDGPVHYARDAFDGLGFMGEVMAGTLTNQSPNPKVPDDAEVLTGTEAKIALARQTDPRYKEVPSGRDDNGAVCRASAVAAAGSIPVPPFWGSRVVSTISMDEVYQYINEVALIRGQWKIRKGRLSDAEYDTLLQERILPELAELKEKVKAEALLDPKVVFGFYPCQSSGNDLIVYDEKENRERLRFTFPRQKSGRHLCLADYFASVESGRMDVVAFHLVTMGSIASAHSAKLFEAGDYKDYLYFHGLSVESAEALAELWHKKIRQELGIAGSDAPEIKRLFSQGYQGARYSFGYPACPNLEDQEKLMMLLDGERIGVRLTEGYSLDPEQSTNAIVVHHPDARYFSIE